MKRGQFFSYNKTTIGLHKHIELHLKVRFLQVLVNKQLFYHIISSLMLTIPEYATKGAHD